MVSCSPGKEAAQRTQAGPSSDHPHHTVPQLLPKDRQSSSLFVCHASPKHLACNDPSRKPSPPLAARHDVLLLLPPTSHSPPLTHSWSHSQVLPGLLPAAHSISQAQNNWPRAPPTSLEPVARIPSQVPAPSTPRWAFCTSLRPGSPDPGLHLSHAFSQDAF